MNQVTIRKKEKECRECHRVLPNTEEYFNNNKNCKDGLETKCKKCMKKIKLKRYKNVIYEIYCIPEDMYYVGQTVKPLNDRISKHFSDAKRGRDQPLYDAIRKYGRENFTYKEIEFVKNKDDMDDRERFWIDRYSNKDKKFLYNVEIGGKRGCYGNRTARSKYENEDIMLFDTDGNLYGTFDGLKELKSELKSADAISSLKTYYTSTYWYPYKFIGILQREFSEQVLQDRINLANKIIESLNDTVAIKGNNHMSKTTYAYDMNRKFLRKFASAREAGEYFKISEQAIRGHALNGKPIFGYYFSYKEI